MEREPGKGWGSPGKRNGGLASLGFESCALRCYSWGMALSDVVKEFETRFPKVEQLVADVEQRVKDLEERAQKALDSLKAIESDVQAATQTPAQAAPAQPPAPAAPGAPARPQ